MSLCRRMSLLQEAELQMRLLYIVITAKHHDGLQHKPPQRRTTTCVSRVEEDRAGRGAPAHQKEVPKDGSSEHPFILQQKLLRAKRTAAASMDCW